MEGLTPITHTVCGGIAFYYDGRPVMGSLIEVTKVTLPDGTKPDPGDRMVCPACGADMFTGDLRWE